MSNHKKISRWIWMGALVAVPAVGAFAAPDSLQIATSSEQLDAQIITAQEQRASVQVHIDELNAKLAELQSGDSNTNIDVRQHARLLYRISRAGMLPVTEGFHVMLQYSSRLERYSALISRLLVQQKAAHERTDSLRRAVASAQAEYANLDRDVVDLQERRDEMLEQDAQAQDYLPTTRGEPELVRDIDEPIDSDNFKASADSIGFESRKGLLALPVHGTLQMRDATRNGSRGVEFLSEAGKEVHGASAGRVAFVRYPSPNNATVVMEHGDGFYTLYSGIGQVDVQPGDWVGEGARIGRVAAGNPAAIFFEVRRSDKTLNARDWLGF